ncbi:uncharacterized protein BT62DRAFT_772638 [Guyanagaster necrorhizus]|uniref:Uncharacterized protein n=1 Tax=Guyanagaster necrorhizus TaxID=856835 RepID=A0A9P7VE34_9AGAR|nr:uncharacterized protein BT62DRAFT_772638 [Guyanagaster necrorhizus MCA 3950]KAG7439216.1 hypothetical protein BT62DRAFT_772638 [Guyanagaster necrorhizus MCA 3950]
MVCILPSLPYPWDEGEDSNTYSEPWPTVTSSSATAATQSYSTDEPRSSSTTRSIHPGVIIGIAIGGIAVILVLLLLLVFFRSRYKERKRKSQIPDPYLQRKITCTSDPTPSPEMQTLDTPPAPSGVQDSHDDVGAPNERARLEQLESMVRLLITERQRSCISEIHEPPPDYTLSNLSTDRTS